MTSAWSGSISQLKKLIDGGDFITEISRGFELAYQRPNEIEIQSWKISIPELIKVVADPIFDNLQILLELQMPIGAERADMILLGGSPDVPCGLVLELKQWSGISIDPVTLEVDVPGIGIHQHPSLQALNYAGKLHFFNARAHNYQIKAATYLHNASNKDKTQLEYGSAKTWTESAPVYTRGETNVLAKILADHLLPINLPCDEHVTFGNAPYDQSSHLFSFLQAHAQDIAKDAALAIANTGMGLTSEQDRVKHEIISAVIAGEKQDFIIQGIPGSGKTLLAVSLLLKAAENKISTALALRNNRLQAILRQVFDRAYPGASGLMMYFEPRQGVGIAQFNGHLDLLICDEAQRMEARIMPVVLSKANVSAIFLDETQRLNPPEQGTIQNFSNASHSIGRTPIVRALTTSIRVPVRYSRWVEKLLNDPMEEAQLSTGIQAWNPGYIFKVADSIESLLHDLFLYRHPDNRVALVASFTESPGNINSIEHPDNIRVGYPLTSGFSLYRDAQIRIPWLMSTSHYKQFWVGRSSNNLDRIASIYGSQGFESDYVGVIWGRDFVYRDGQWRLGDPNVCYDAIDRLITGRRGNQRWSPDAFDLMINRYRIFLTRGIKGTIIFAEDDETRAYLLSLLRN